MAENSQGTRSDTNLLGALCYFLGWVTGVILWFSVPKTNKFIRFHAMQSIIFSVVLMIIFFALLWVPVIGWVISGLVGLLAFVLWIVLMVKAYQAQMYKLPVIGDLADNWSK
jgi:uncharacterized membrane protein